MAVLAAAMLLVVWVTALPSAVLPTVVCNISDHGGVLSPTVSTAAFRAAAAACAGQGTARARAVVLVPAGTWLTGAFNLSSHTELRLEVGDVATDVIVWSTGVLLLLARPSIRSCLTASVHLVTPVPPQAGATIAAVNTMDRIAFPAVAPFPSYGVCNDGTLFSRTNPTRPTLPNRPR